MSKNTRMIIPHLTLFSIAFQVVLTAPLPSVCKLHCPSSSRDECESRGCVWDARKLPACIRYSSRIKCAENSDGEQICLQRGCQYQVSSTVDAWCFYPDYQHGILNISDIESSCKVGCDARTEASCAHLGCEWNEDYTPACHGETSKIACGDRESNRDDCSKLGCVWESESSKQRNSEKQVPKCSYPSSPKYLIDCHPDPQSTIKRCQKRGCLWYKHTTDPRAPKCVFSDAAGYNVTRIIKQEENEILVEIERMPTPTLFGDDLQKLGLHARVLGRGYIGVNVADINASSHGLHENANSFTSWLAPHQNGHSDFDIDAKILVKESNLGLKIVRKSSNFTIFDNFDIPGLTIADSYSQISTKLSTKYIYGFGELTHTKLRQDITWRNFAIWNRDSAPDPENKQDQNLYGFHPFYIGIEPDGKAHGVRFTNPTAKNFAFQPDPDILTARSVSGSIGMQIIIGNSPEDVIAILLSNDFDYLRPVLPPRWGLGYQLSRYGYRDLDHVQDVYERNTRIGLPLDTLTLDIDYMDRKRSFTVDEQRFGGLANFTQSLHQNFRKLVLIIDPGISIHPEGYPPVEDGLRLDVFIKDANGTNLKGVVWPGQVYFPDFMHPNVQQFWEEQLQRLNMLVQFDGLCYDMNEPSNFVDGSIDNCYSNQFNTPPYNPLVYDAEPFFKNTICNDAEVHNQNINFGSLHSFYGYFMAKVGYQAVKSVRPGRPYILSRSTAIGSGHFTAHWSGDIPSSWAGLRYSVINMMEFGFFGVPWIGSDICGFFGDADEELCIRWHQVGMFYPFARNHNFMDNRDQDPASWSKPAQEIILKFVKLRYQMLPFLYTEIVKAHLTGIPAVRPLFFEYPTDQVALDISDQFLWGRHVMIAPILEQGANKRKIYFPDGKFYDVFSQQIIDTPGNNFVITLLNISQTAAYIRGGVILPFQESANASYEASLTPLNLFVALDRKDSANGELYLDDQEHPDPYKSSVANFDHFEFLSSVSSNGVDFDGYVIIHHRHSSNLTLFIPSLQTVSVSGANFNGSSPVYFGVNGNYGVQGKAERRAPYSLRLLDLKVDISSTKTTVITFTTTPRDSN